MQVDDESLPFFYLCASGPEAVLKRLDAMAQVDGSTIRNVGIALPVRQTVWQVPRVDCSSLYPEDEALEYLRDNNRVTDAIRAVRTELEWCGLNIGWSRASCRGVTIRVELAKELVDLGMELDMDVTEF